MRPVLEPKEEKEHITAQKFSYTQACSTSDTSVAGAKNRSLGCDETVLSEKVKPSSLTSIKLLPRGIGYAETINAGKSRFERNHVFLEK